MPQFADFEQARAWLAQHPQVRYVDLLLPDQMGIPRGKRVTVAELEGVHRQRPAAAGIDVRARRARRHDAVHGPRLRRGRRRPPLPAAARLAACRCRGSASTSRRCRSRCTSTTAAPFFGDPRHVLERGARPLRRTRPDARSWRSNSSSTSSIASGRPRATRSRRASRCRAGARTRRRSTRWPSSTSTRPCSRRSTRPHARRSCPAGTVLAEYGPGQFEVNLHHVDDALLACDHAIRLKRLVKGVALAARHGRDLHAEAVPRSRRQRHAPARQPGRCRRPQHLRRRRPAGHAGAAPRDRRPRRDDQRHAWRCARRPRTRTAASSPRPTCR